MKKHFLSIIFFLTAFTSIAQIIADRQKMTYDTITKVISLENSDPVDLSGLVGGSSTVTDYTALSALSSPSTGDVAIVTNVGTGGTFIYDSTKSATDNGGTIIDGWVRQWDGSIHSRWWGTDGASLQAAIDYAESLGDGHKVMVDGYTPTDQDINISGNVAITIEGNGPTEIFTNFPGYTVNVGNLSSNTSKLVELKNLIIRDGGQYKTKLKIMNHRRFNGTGLKLAEGLEGVRVTTRGDGAACYQINFDQCEFTGNKDYGIYILAENGGGYNYTNDVNVSNSYIADNDVNARIEIETGAGDATAHKFTNVYFDNGDPTKRNLEIVGSHGNFFSNCTFDGRQDGIDEIVLDVNTYDNYFAGNRIIDGYINDLGTRNKFDYGVPSINHFNSSRNISVSDIQNTLLVNATGTLTITPDFDRMLKHQYVYIQTRQQTLTIQGDVGVTVNGVSAGTVVIGDDSSYAWAIIRKGNTNSYEVYGVGGSGGDFTKVGTTADNQILVATGDGTVESSSGFTRDGNTLTHSGGGFVSGVIESTNNSTAQLSLKTSNTQHDIRGYNGEGLFRLASSTYLTVPASGSLLFTRGLDVTGNISLSGTVDGRDIAADGTKLDGIEPGATVDQTLSVTGPEGNQIAISGGNTVSIKEGIEDTMADAFFSGAHSGITITYDDVNGNFDFEVTGGTGLTTEQELRIDNLNVRRRIVVNSDNVVSTSANARTTDTPFEGKVHTVVDGNYNFLLNNVEPLNTLFTVEAGESATDSIIVKRNNTDIKFVIDGIEKGVVADDYDGFSLRHLKTALVERIADNKYKVSCNCYPFTDIPACTPAVGNLNTGPNAASDANCNEANATTGFHALSVTLTSDPDSSVGDYALKGVATALASSYIGYTFSVVSGRTYTLTCKVRQTIGTSGILHTLAGDTLLTGDPRFQAVADNSTVWESKSYTMTATGSGSVTIGMYAANSGALGDTVWVDDWKLIETTP